MTYCTTTLYLLKWCNSDGCSWFIVLIASFFVNSEAEVEQERCPQGAAQPCVAGVPGQGLSCSPSNKLIMLVPFLQIDRDFWLFILAQAIRRIQLLRQPLFSRAGYQVCCRVGAFTGLEWNLSSPCRWFNLYSSFKSLQGQSKQISEQNFKWYFKQVAEHRTEWGKRWISRSLDV